MAQTRTLISETAPAERHRPVYRSTDGLLVALRTKQKTPYCFRSEERHLCGEQDCRWRAECRRLVAEWKR